VAEALDHVAALKIIHRDIKPANILLTAQRQAKLADLGLAKQNNEDTAGQEALTMQGVFLGSPAYMAPEQVRNARDVTHAADVYSLGATFYHTLCGSPPFEGRNASDVMTKVLREDPRPVHELEPGVPRDISKLVHKMLSKNVKERPQNAAEFLSALKSAVEGTGKSSKPARRRSVTGDFLPPSRLERFAFFTISALAVIGVMALVVWLIWFRDR
jgi:serine/threonine-protein kinase